MTVLSRERIAKAMISLYGCFKNTFIFDRINDAVHVEFHLYFSKIRCEKKFSSSYTVHIYNVYISITESITGPYTGLHRS